MKAENYYKLHETTPKYLELVRQHKEPYVFHLNGEDILIMPGVMSPKYDWAGHFMIEHLPDVKDKTVLEVGCGCGLVSMAAFRRGAREILAVDINKKAVINTNENFQRIGAQKNSKAIWSDVFSEVTGKFDVVIFNAPYHGCKASDDLEKGVADENYSTLKSFFSNLHKVTTNNSILVLGFSSSGDYSVVENLISANGLKQTDFFEDIRCGYQCEVRWLHF